jgi:putative transposase
MPNGTPMRVLIADSNPAFATMMQQVLQESGQFEVAMVGTGAEAVSAFSKTSYDLAILESTLDDFSLRDIVSVLRARQPNLPIMVFPSSGEDISHLDLQGTLSKPFYIPDLQNLIEEALAKPVGGVTPAPRPSVKPASSAPTPPRPPATLVRRTPNLPPAPAWLEDEAGAKRILGGITGDSSALAAVVTRRGHHAPLTTASGLSESQVSELANFIAEASSEGGSQTRFIRLESGADYLIYSTVPAADVVLSLAYPADTPLTIVRKQAKRATEMLLRPTIADEVESLAGSAPVDTMTMREAPLTGWTAPGSTPGQPSRDWSTADSGFEPPQRSTRPIPDIPFTLQPVPIPNARRTPHGLYALSYTFLIIPQLPHTQLVGDLKHKLEEWIKRLALAHDWRINALSVEPDHVEISLDCAPTEAPANAIRAIVEKTSAQIFADFPRLAEEHARRPGAFWASGYYVIVPGRRLSTEEIIAFVEHQRREQVGERE